MSDPESGSYLGGHFGSGSEFTGRFGSGSVPVKFGEIFIFKVEMYKKEIGLNSNIFIVNR